MNAMPEPSNIALHARPTARDQDHPNRATHNGASAESSAPSSVDWWSEVSTGASEPEPVTDPQPSPNPAGLWTAFRSGAVEDPAAKRRLFAATRFPHLTAAERESRYGEVGGRVFYIGDDGKPYLELSGPGRFASGVAEYGPAIAGGAALSLAAPPAGLAAVGAAALGAAGGLAYRKVAGEVQGDDQDALGNMADMATEGALSGAGTGIGLAVGKHLVDRRALRDLPRLSESAVQKLDDLARSRGITLTPAELTNLGSLIQQQTMLGQGADEASDTLRAFYGERGDKLLDVIDSFIGSTPGPHTTGQMASEASQGIIDTATGARTAAVRPEYLRLMHSGVELPRDHAARLQAMVMDDPYIGQVLKRVKSDPLWVSADDINITRLPDTSLAVLDRAKKLIDHEIDIASSRGGREAEVAMLMRRKEKLLSITDNAFPDYAAVRAKFEGMSPEIDELQRSTLGVVSKYKGTHLESAAGTLVNTRSDPARVAWAREQFGKAGKGAEWDTIASQAMRDTLENIRTTVTAVDNVGPKFRKAIYGTERTREVMRAALGPQRFQDLDDLMQVLEAVGRVPRGQSITHFAGEAAKREARQASPVATFLRNIKISDPGGEFLEAVTDRSVEKYRGMMAKIITSRDAMRTLKQMRVLRSLSPTSQRRLNVAGQILAQAAGHGAGAALRPGGTTLPPRSARR